MAFFKATRTFRAFFKELQALRLELYAIRIEMQGINLALARAIDLLAAPPAPPPPQPPPSQESSPVVEVGFVDPGFQQEYAAIEERLTYATGQPPTEDEILAVWDREREELDQDRIKQ